MPRVYHKFFCGIGILPVGQAGILPAASQNQQTGSLSCASADSSAIVLRTRRSTKKFRNFFFSSAAFLLYKTALEEFIDSVSRQILPRPQQLRAAMRAWLGIAVLALIVPPASADPFPDAGPVVSGKIACLRFGRAAAPKHAPLAVKRAIWAANQLRSKPYRYGGGHKSFDDRGYDCSGTISYVLAAAGLISSPISSTEFRSYGERGAGKWITVYAREGHTFAVIAGLRLDTTPFDHYTGKWGLSRGKPFIGRRVVLMQDIRSGCSGGSETDARTHRTPKHSVRNARETRVLFRVSFGSAHASPRRFARISD